MSFFKHLLKALLIVLLLSTFCTAQTLTPELNLTTSTGTVDDKAKIWRNNAGTLYFKDADNPTTKSLSDLITAGITDHGFLTGLADDDHTMYQTAARHTGSHTAGYNMALPINDDVIGNKNLGDHLTDATIHLQKPGKIVTVAKSGGYETSIQAAINSITDAGPSNPYIIQIAPGIYSEKVTLSKSYISLIGLQPKGAKLTETQESGTIITYASGGQGDDLMTLSIASSGAVDLKGITISNLTIINMASPGIGSMQAAVSIGRNDPYPRAHEIALINCSLYGEDKALYIETGNPRFRNCYVEGESEVVTLQDDAIFHNCRIKSHNSDYEFLVAAGRTGSVAFTAEFAGCIFEANTWGSTGKWTASGTALNFYNCCLTPNVAANAWSSSGYTGAIYLHATNGTAWPSGLTYDFWQPFLHIGNNAEWNTFFVEPGVISMRDASLDFNFLSPDDNHALWAGFLGIEGDAALMTTDLNQTDFRFKRWVTGDTERSRGALMEVEHKVHTETEQTNDASLLVLKNTKGDAGEEYKGATGNAIEYWLDGDLKFVLDKDGDIRTSGTITAEGLLGGAAYAQTVTVAKSGGDFTTIQAAIDSITDASAAKPYVVLIYPGVYNEKISIGSGKGYIALVGIQNAGAKLNESKLSGVIITHSSSGNEDDLMVVDIATRDSTSLGNVTLCNLTIINTQNLGIGAAQAAIMIGRNDPVNVFHEVFVKNCSLYGEQDTVLLYSKGSLIMQDCYIEGDNDIVTLQEDSLLERCMIYSHRETAGASCLWLGFWDDSPMTATFIDCIFDTYAVATLKGVGYFGHNNVTANFYNCTVMPNTASGCWNFANSTGSTLNLYSTNGINWGSNKPETSFLNYLTQHALNLGTSTGAGTGSIKLSGGVNSEGTGTGTDGNLMAGDLSVAKGVNVGTSTGAGTGSVKLSGRINTEGTGTGADGNLFQGDVSVAKGINVGTATAAGTGDIKTSGDVTVGGNDLNFTNSANIDLFGASADTTLSVLNSNATFKANLNVENTVRPNGGYLCPDGTTPMDGTVQFKDFNENTHTVVVKSGLIYSWTY